MHAPVRGLAWTGAYLALVLGPLGVALLCDPIATPRPFLVELAVAAGLVAFALLCLELALVSRLTGAAVPFGLDALLAFHRLTGVVALVFVLAHALPLAWRAGGLGALLPSSGTTSWRAGPVALLALLLLIGTSFGRRRLGLGYVPWRLAHGLLATLLVLAMLVHSLGVGRYAAAGPVRSTLVGYLALFLALALRHRVVRPWLCRRRPWEVLANRDEGADTRTLVLAPVGHSGLAFEPGQFVWLDTRASPWSLDPHPISIASSAERPPDGPLELTIKALGDWSRHVVPALLPGSRVALDGPFGRFSPERVPGEGFVLIAGGVGITPMRSMLATLADRGEPRPMLLIYATSHPSREIWRDDLARLAQRLDLRIVRVHEHPVPGESDESGYVTLDVLRRRLPPHFVRLQHFVCGPPAMIEAVEDALLALGVPGARIHTERFEMV